MKKPESLQPSSSWRRGDAGVTWIIVSLLVIVLVGIVFFYLSSIENSHLKRQADERLNDIKEKLEGEKELYRKELSSRRVDTASVQAEIDRNYQALTDELQAEREVLRQHRNAANRAEYQISTLQSEIEGIESMIAETNRQIDRFRSLVPGAGRQERSMAAESDQSNPPTGPAEPAPRIALSPESQRPPTQQRPPKQAIIEDVLLKIGKTLESRGLRAAADAKGPVVSADGFKIRDLDAELGGASIEQRKIAAENVRLARQELQQSVVMAGINLKKHKLPPFEFEILNVLETMRAGLVGEN